MTLTSSPKWTSTTKLVVGLTVAAIIAALVIYFREIIGPLLLAFILSYLLHPLADQLSSIRGLSWRFSVNIIYILLIIIIAGSTTLLGLAVIQETQSLVEIVQEFLGDLPTLLENLATTTYSIGPFKLDLSGYLNLDTIGDQLISNLQGLVGRAGTLVGSVASSAAGTIGWTIFVLIISYFILADAGKVPDAIHFLNIPGYADDIRRMSREMARLWNAFLRGQITIVLIVILVYSILLAILGVRYSIAIAILAGFARFVPYLGPFITYVVMGLVTLFQPDNYFGLNVLQYTLMVIGISIFVDQIFDNLVSPRILGQSLGVHPAAVLVVAIIATNLIGLIGLVLAAPVLASVQLIGRYTIRKMFDQDPWPGIESKDVSIHPTFLVRLFRRLRAWWRLKRGKLTD
jgi:predicted PurR-regulated permease PerM